MRTAAVRRVSDPVPLVGDTTGTTWDRSEPVEIDRFLWTTPEHRPRTKVRALYDEESLYLHYEVADRHSYATTTTLNGSVWEDSCVEFFASPRPAVCEAYVNFEVNCVGTYHLGYGPDRANRTLVEPETADAIRVRTSIDGPTKRPHADDDEWWIAAKLPFDVLSDLSGVAVAPSPGTRWRGNFYRLRSRPEPLYAAWNPVDAPEPDFHRPSAFGELRFR
ncbi:carbohydrate-binding family 9-like protein [Halorubrum amylolyticum]|uniref:carbohydrate-binding family 9-like protein n=1 Tax=Halorubrum amylolyticum TaxID=2508724 RepID=UPI0010087ABC|nr:carbohydrate-binding family 9-like protein [Halorubrum amylolyticum]